ncbi:uncharacterized protein LOC112568871 [Pomacea canaliculata]|uniref:uncharacterized protein LOC112568871 n=1 Tax=Pomacea canaliculata TaxID=400727 RepID=UPI000D73DB35|nr:uncharacterized protein LOC112568871 [Pomacea canaliculata]
MRTRYLRVELCPKLTIDSWGSPVVRPALYQSWYNSTHLLNSTLGRNTMASMSTESIWNSTSFQDGNRTQEEIDDYLEKLNYETFIKLVPMVVLLVVLIVVGVSGNLLVFLVYLKQFKPSSTRVFVLEMAVCDFFTNVLVLPWLIQDMRYSYTSRDFFCKMKAFLMIFPIAMSFLILVCVALDRRRRICQFRKRQLSARHATYLLTVPLTLACSIAIPFTILYGSRPLETDVPGITGSTCDNLDTSVGIRVKRAFGFVLMSYFTVGFVLLAASYIQISHRVYQQKKKLARQTNLNSNSHAMKTQLNKTSESISESAGPSDTNTPGSDVTSKSVTVSEESTSSPDQEESLLVKKTRNGGEDIRRVEASNFGQDPEITVSPLVTSPPVPEASDLSKGGDTRSFLGDCPRDTTATPLHPETSKKTENGCRCRKGETANPGSNHQDGKPRQQKRAFVSRTTVMMFVLTVTSLVCYSPYMAVKIAKLEYVNVGLSAWTLNLNFLARFFPIINSVINPFIYSFCNSKFRLQCRQFFTKVRNFFCTQV